jgi:6-phosphogluconolactonase (cycloisomerase 2 family)
MLRILPNKTLLALFPMLLVACGGGGSGAGDGGAGSGSPSGLTYGQAEFVVLLGAPIDSLVPSVQGNVLTWSLTPGLPSGLSFAIDTGTISGSPTEVWDTTTYTVTADNNQGGDSVSFDLRVATPARFLYAAGNDRTLSTFSVDAVTGRLWHYGYALDPAAKPVAEQPVHHPLASYLYVPNLGDAVSPSNISFFRRKDDGRLEAGAPAPVGAGPHRLALRDDGLSAYATSFGDDEAWAYAVDGATGALVPMGSPVPVGNQPLACTVDPARRFLYVANRGDFSISVVPLDPSTGAPLGPGQAFVLNGGLPSAVAAESSGRVLLVTLENFDLLIALVVEEVTGDLTVVSQAPTGAQPSAVVVGPTGTQVLVANAGDGSVSTYDLDLSTGELNSAGPPLPVGGDPVSIALDDAGRFAYVACRSSHEVVSLDMTTSPAPQVVLRARTRPGPLGLTLAPGGRPVRPRTRALYSANVGDGTVSIFSANPDNGTLTEVGVPVLVGAQPSDVTVDPFARFAWVASRGDDTVQTFSVNQVTWDLAAQGLPQSVADEPAGIGVDSSGRFVFVTSATTDLVVSYGVDEATGALTKLDQATTGAGPGAVVVDPTGQFVIVANQTGGSLSAFRVGINGDFIEALSGDSAPGAPTGLAFSPDGARLYAALNASNLVIPYQVDPVSGNLSLQTPGSPVASEPWTMLPNPVAARAYSALGGPGDGGLAVFGLDVEGNPTLLQTLTGVGMTPVDLAIDPVGRFLYSANLGGDNVGRFVLDSNGDAVFAGVVPAGDGPLALSLLRRVE